MMFKRLALAIAVVSFGVETLAQSSLLTSNKNKFKFSVPVVSQVPTGTDEVNPVGSIVYDISTQGFKGLFQNGAWGPIAQNSYRAPNMIIKTSCATDYEPTAGVLYIKVRIAGGGGGGSSGGTALRNPGDDGNPTTFGGTLLVANGGKGAATSTGTTIEGGDGGTASITLGIQGVSRSGDRGTPGMAVNTTYGSRVNGGNGGNSPFLGAGVGGSFSSNIYVTALANTGSGGGGGGANAVNTDIYSGSGGGAGGYVEAVITSLDPNYPCTVGTAGSGGNAGTSGYAGGNGGSGVIEITEFFQ